ncbi:tyrosine-protein phosphatase [Staphylococcus carnosus]|uniref:Tyrosine-protein phosphatase n=1 Tax=Staphylococcus carnosus (strain TM300) TaxID=396513 RepID=B9DIN3_STACT|nr:CpsB/CapC family capsule biosynthesis tyrosine phosphatase [Staphylococcus carnosus]QPT03014.1 capsular biosynthesis protein [Staphylococcus carnosus]UQA68017.1 capsular biosynthesis protein [Staphylococcus carnosus]UTB77164.1 capsular biosynthesis protein [Staphylococcus carnosus]UTB86711.1 capsular biosynthesis protein [Staphylococcus carnosus]UTB89058.1 capsular biosynthesis protein [Staphylococcus carnosus]
MIDIHNHIISGIDDGPKNEESMLDLIKQAANQGIKGIVATPHHLHTKYSNDFTNVEKRVDKLNDSLEIKELGITIYTGQEIRVSDQILSDIDDGKIQGVNYSKYLLIELPSHKVPHFTQRLIYEIQTRGYIPVIVHPERNKAIAQDVNLLFELINIGALSQLTASSLTGKSGKNIQKLSFQMIEHNLVHFVASDAHSTEQRPFDFGDLFKTPRLDNYQTVIQTFLKNNEAMVLDENIVASRPIEYRKKKFLGLF